MNLKLRVFFAKNVVAFLIEEKHNRFHAGFFFPRWFTVLKQCPGQKKTGLVGYSSDVIFLTYLYSVSSVYSYDVHYQSIQWRRMVS
jgi:hypothetical protein